MGHITQDEVDLAARRQVDKIGNDGADATAAQGVRLIAHASDREFECKGLPSDPSVACDAEHILGLGDSARKLRQLLGGYATRSAPQD